MIRGRLASHTGPTREGSRSWFLQKRWGGARSVAQTPVPEVAGRGGSLLLTDRLLVPMPSIAFGPRGSQHKWDFLGLSALLFLHSDFQALHPVPSEKYKSMSNEWPQSNFEKATMAVNSYADPSPVSL